MESFSMEDKVLKKIESGNYTLIPTWERYLRFLSLLGLVLLIFYIGAWTKDSERNVSAHTDNKNVHMPLQEAQSEFITRREYNITLRNIEKSLEDLNNKIK